MFIQTLLLLITVSWSLVANATGGVLYTCSMKKEVSFNRCCCPTEKAPQREHAAIERLCCDATELEALRVPATLHQQLKAPLAVDLTLPVTVDFSTPIVPEHRWEVVARSTAPPAGSDLYLRIRTLLL